MPTMAVVGAVLVIVGVIVLIWSARRTNESRAWEALARHCLDVTDTHLEAAHDLAAELRHGYGHHPGRVEIDWDTVAAELIDAVVAADGGSEPKSDESDNTGKALEGDV